MKNSIKREQSQACLNFAERKNFRLQAKHKILMTLALLLTAVTGAWADEEPQLLTTITFDANGPVYSESGIVTLSSTGSGITSAGIYYIGPISPTETMVATVDVATGKDVSKVVFYGYDGNDFVYPLEDTEAPYVCYANAEGRVRSLSSDLSNSVGVYRIGKIEVYGHAEPAIDVTPVAGKTNEWTFTMPAFDVEIAPIYAPTAVFATKENLVLTPTAAVDIYAESNDSIVTPGTVAKIGETENVQGTLMYAIGTSATEAPALTAFSATLPTAKDITTAGDVYVWYYIKGADTPEGKEATAENTFNDSEICAEPLKVTVLNNKFNIQFTAANANSIETEKATVTVGGAEATVTEGKLESVKMGSEVKVTAKEGYKFRKVEVKKKALLSIKITGPTNATIYYFEGETWEQAIQNHPTENSAWSIDQEGHISCNWYYLYAGDNLVNSNDTIAPNAGYRFPLS